MAVVGVGLAAAEFFVFGAAVAFAAFFFVGIVAFRPFSAAAFVTAVLVDFEIVAGFSAPFASGVLARALDAALLRAAVDAFALTELALSAADLLAPALLVASFGALPAVDFVFSTLGAAERAFVAVGLLTAVRVAGFAGRAALARLTDAAGCAAVRAAALDAVAGLAVRADGLLAAADLAVAAFEADFAAAGLVAVRLVAAGFTAVDLAAAGLRAAAFATLRSRAAGLVLGDMSATPEIGLRQGA